MQMLLVILFTLFSAWYDEGKRFTSHHLRWVFRVVVVAIISYTTQDIVASFFLHTAIFYALFDLTLNLLERREWNYVGHTAITDKVKHILFEEYVGFLDPVHKAIFLIFTIFAHERFI